MDACASRAKALRHDLDSLTFCFSKTRSQLTHADRRQQASRDQPTCVEGVSPPRQDYDLDRACLQINKRAVCEASPYLDVVWCLDLTPCLCSLSLRS